MTAERFGMPMITEKRFNIPESCASAPTVESVRESVRRIKFPKPVIVGLRPFNPSQRYK